MGQRILQSVTNRAQHRHFMCLFCVAAVCVYCHFLRIVSTQSNLVISVRSHGIMDTSQRSYSCCIYSDHARLFLLYLYNCRGRTSSVSDHFGRYHFGTWNVGFSTFGLVRYMTSSSPRHFGTRSRLVHEVISRLFVIVSWCTHSTGCWATSEEVVITQLLFCYMWLLHIIISAVISTIVFIVTFLESHLINPLPPDFKHHFFEQRWCYSRMYCPTQCLYMRACKQQLWSWLVLIKL